MHGLTLLKRVGYTIAILLPPLIVATTGLVGMLSEPWLSTPPPLDRPLPPPPAHDPAKLTAVLIADNNGTEITDFLGPYEVLAASGAFNVYAVAPERRGTPLTAGLDIVPHYSFDEYDAAFGAPDLLVVPFLADYRATGDDRIVQWIRAHAGENTVVMSICGGALNLAKTGLLDGRPATTHHNVRAIALRDFPHVNWVRGKKYVEDGNIISSAGITSGIDATLHAVHRLAGREAADSVVAKLNYPHARFLDDPTYDDPAFDSIPANFGAPVLSAAFQSDRPEIGVVLYEGVDELALSSILDTYPMPSSISGAVTAKAFTIARERRAFTSRYGLTLVPRHTFTDAPSLDRVLIAGADAPVSVRQDAQRWARERYGRDAEIVHQTGTFVYDSTLMDMGARLSRSLAATEALAIEYPITHLTLNGRAWPLDVLIRPFAWALVGAGCVLLFRRWRRAPARRELHPALGMR